MAKQKKQKHHIHLKYRISFIDEETFDEVRRVRLSLLNVLLILFVAFTLFGGLVAMLIFHTPIREYIPGYPDSKTKATMLQNAEALDSLMRRYEREEAYWNAVRNILRGEIPESFEADSSIQRNREVIPEHTRLAASQEEMRFRTQVEQEEQYNLRVIEHSTEHPPEQTLLFSPIKGVITDHFNAKNGHFGVDLATAPDEHILSVAAGTVILADYSITAGNMISIQHPNNIISTYRHASVLMKKPGEKVKAGEVIGRVGGTGTLSMGVHLHLEIWQDGEAVDPESVIAF